MASSLAGTAPSKEAGGGEGAGGESFLMLFHSCPAGAGSFGPGLHPPLFLETLPPAVVFQPPTAGAGGLSPDSPPLPPFPFQRLPATFLGPPPPPPRPALPLLRPPPLPRPVPVLAAPFPGKRSSPRKRSLEGTPDSEQRPPSYRFTAQELHAVLYGAVPGGRQPRALSAGDAESQPPLLDRSTLQLPKGLTVLQTVFLDGPQLGVFCTETILKGIRFGPFQGKVVNTSEIKTYDDNSLMWEIFEDGQLSHFIDGRGSSGNWMSLVNCARFPEEQNLTALQCQGQIYYESCKEITPGQELLVWYGDCYSQFLGIPISLKGTAEGKRTRQHSEESVEGYKCERCGKVFAYRYYRDKHLKYTRCVDQGDRKFPCHLCNRSFEKRDRLRIHVLHVHEKHRPHKNLDASGPPWPTTLEAAVMRRVALSVGRVSSPGLGAGLWCSVCGKSFSQSSSLNKHTRVHSGERPYKCVYCNKAFTASSILRTHIRQHSGEKPFKCKHCGKAFASHAAHDSHVRRTHNAKDKGCTCTLCGKVFLEAEEFHFHMKFHAAL